MKRADKSEERRENLGEKLKRGGHSTPTILSSWHLPHAHHSTTIKLPPFPTPSARKLAASLWEIQHYNSSKMHHGLSANLRRHKDKSLHHPTSSHHLPESPGSLRRHLAASLMQHNRSVQRNNRAIQPVSPASYGTSSMEVAPYNPAVTPTSSIDRKGGIGETSYNLKTSTELLKVLNRIWGLEEQHAANISLVRELKKELDHARAKIKGLVHDQQVERREVDELMKQIAEDTLSRKSKEHDRISAAVQSARDELEDERKLRKRSESLHRKLAREVYEVKTSLAISLKEVEKERKSRKLLEELCDEFALEIRDYEQEVHVLKQKSDKNWTSRADHDRLILHLSESWIDERIQMKQEEPQHGLGEKNSIVEKLSSEIEAFLRAKRNGNDRSHDKSCPKGPTFRRTSLESMPLNLAVSAPQDEGDEEDSTGSDSHCFELDKPGHVELKPQGHETEGRQVHGAVKPNHAKKKLISQEREESRHPTSLQVNFEEQMAQAISRNESNNQVEDEICEVTEEGSHYNREKADEAHGLSSHYLDNLIRNNLLSENGNAQPESDCGNPAWRSHASPVRQWTARLPSQDLDLSESSSQLPPKEGTLKTKLLEARIRGQKSRSRMKPSKVSF